MASRVPERTRSRLLWMAARVAVAEEKGGGGFGGVGEAVQVGELDRPDVVDDQPERSAGLDGAELAWVADEPDSAPRSRARWSASLQVQGAGHPGFIDEQHVAIRQVEEVVTDRRMVPSGVACWCRC